MSTQQLIAENKQGAEIHRDPALCKQKCHELLDELNLPKGILPLNNLTEMGYNRATGFLWLRQNKRYNTSSMLSEKPLPTTPRYRRLLRTVGCIPSSGKVRLTGAAGLSMSFPTSAFEL
ncbi:hypothetical protein Patl1_10065 [Pistacia atlantica]|uniref:Uncharacterized protein n=1 Tax=Pistacia atlantica TaxID=434234 RepID=A0ACC1A3M4_9ROSI|nr:hypothetical protein Patl1_10065 [Pistacia atlantica]